MTLAVLLIVLPLLGAVLCLAGTERSAKGVGLIASLVVLGVSIACAFQFPEWHTGQFWPNQEGWKIFSAFGVDFLIGTDSVGMLLILLTALLIPCSMLVSFSAITQRQRGFYAQFLFMESAVMLAFLSRDVILFYIGYEFTLVPLFLIVAIWGGHERRTAAVKLWVYSFVGSVISLIGFIYLAAGHAGDGTPITFSVAKLTEYGQSLPADTQWWVFLAIMGGFAVKVPFVPVHSWLPLAHGEAPTAGSVVLAGIVIKIGQYGALRFAFPMAPEGALALSHFFAVLALIGILGMSLVCWVQNDVKRLIAYSSIAHMGLALLAMFAFNVVGMEGGVLYMVNHGLSTAGMFMCVGIMYERYHTKDMEVVGGLMQRMPVWSVFMVFFAMASLALPGLNGFISEFLCLMGIYTAESAMKTGFPGILGPTYAFLAALALILGALYVLRMLQKFVFGPLREPSHEGHGQAGHGAHAASTIRDLNAREFIAMAPLAIACLVIGLWPQPLLQVIEPVATQVVSPYVKLIERGPVNDAETKRTNPSAPTASRESLSPGASVGGSVLTATKGTRE